MVIRVGDSRPEKVDIRIVAATNKVLEDEVKRNAFREDLYYRLNVVNLQLPPLRDRGDDDHAPLPDSAQGFPTTAVYFGLSKMSEPSDTCGDQSAGKVSGDFQDPALQVFPLIIRRSAHLK